jgi:hypothetical protein
MSLSAASAATPAVGGAPSSRAGQFRYMLNAGSARVLNLVAPMNLLLAENPHPKSAFFKHQDLNLSYVIKETDDQAIARGKRGDPTLMTKLFFPFNRERPYEGGHSIHLSDDQYEQLLKDFVAFDPEKNPETGEHDRAVFRMVRQLPSLDPFLLKDQLEALDIEVDARFLQISKPEWDRIRTFIVGKFSKLVEVIALEDRDGQRPVTHRAAELVDQLWRPTDKEKIANLMASLRVSPERNRDVLYSWKGVIYYEYQYGQMTPRLKQLAEWLAHGTQPLDFARSDMKKVIEQKRASFRDKIRASIAEVRGLIAEYQSSFDDLVADEPLVGPFIAFLNVAPTKFSILGIALGRLSHALEMWDRCTATKPDRRCTAVELLDLLNLLDQSL